MEEQTGKVYITVANLDYERETEQLVSIVGRDTALMRKSTTVTVTVRILDVDDNVPVFIQTQFTKTVPENDAGILVATVQVIIVFTCIHNINQFEYILIVYKITDKRTLRRFKKLNQNCVFIKF